MKVGDKATMLFHGAGVTSKEKMSVTKVTANQITLDGKWIFNAHTGRCINDLNDFGFWRELALPKHKPNKP